jgi:nucleoside-diphosphate-sugar epimerase
MRVLVTGAGGFVGHALVRALGDAHDVVALDRSCAGVQAAEVIEGDLSDGEVVGRAVGDGVDAVVHLATVPGGAAEQDPDLGWRVNVEGSGALLAALTRLGTRPRFVFASSIAAIGTPPSTGVDDATPLRPTMLYGAHKAMVEQWIATMSRRGAIHGLSLRLSGIVARPPGPSGMKSAFMSDIFHAALARRPFVSPVSPAATMWLMSLSRVVGNFRHALEAVQMREPYALTLPAVRTSIAELVAELARQTGGDPAFVSYDPDPMLEAGFGGYPPLDAGIGREMGFSDDGSLAELVAAALDRIRQGY